MLIRKCHYCGQSEILSDSREPNLVVVFLNVVRVLFTLMEIQFVPAVTRYLRRLERRSQPSRAFQKISVILFNKPGLKCRCHNAGIVNPVKLWRPLRYSKKIQNQKTPISTWRCEIIFVDVEHTNACALLFTAHLKSWLPNQKKHSDH